MYKVKVGLREGTVTSKVVHRSNHYPVWFNGTVEFIHKSMVKFIESNENKILIKKVK